MQAHCSQQREKYQGTWLHNCDKKLNWLQSLCIHKPRWYKQYNFPIRECKSNDGVMNLDCTQSIQDPIVEQQRCGEILSQPRIKWPKGNQKAIRKNLDQKHLFTLTTNYKGSISRLFLCKILWRLFWVLWPSHGKGKKMTKRLKIKSNIMTLRAQVKCAYYMNDC